MYIIIGAWHATSAAQASTTARRDKHHAISKLTTRHITHLRNQNSPSYTHQTTANNSTHNG